MDVWAVSSHGSHQRAASRNYIVLPAGVEVVFYTAPDKVLSSDRAWMILAALRANDEARALGQAYETKKPFDRVQNYTAYGTNDFTSGIFKIGGGLSKEEMADGLEMTLYDIIYGGKGFGEHKGRIHWLACTEFDRPV